MPLINKPYFGSGLFFINFYMATQLIQYEYSIWFAYNSQQNKKRRKKIKPWIIKIKFTKWQIDEIDCNIQKSSTHIDTNG